MIDLDKYLSTPDELFNTNVQYWYFNFSGSNKPDTNKNFKIFAEALHEIYFFIKENLDKPFLCIDKVKKVCGSNKLNKTEKVILIDKTLAILHHSADTEEIKKVYIQLIDFRNELSPYILDQSILDFQFAFDVDTIKEDFSKIPNNNDKQNYLMNLILDFYNKSNEINEVEQEYYISVGFLDWINAELARLKFVKNSDEKPIPLTPKTFEELFFEPKYAEISLNVLRELKPPVIDAENNYIGKNKGVFPVWVNVLKTNKPNALIKHFRDSVYKDLLNEKITGLNLSKDASEFRKQYKRLEQSNKEADIRFILSHLPLPASASTIKKSKEDNSLKSLT